MFYNTMSIPSNTNSMRYILMFSMLHYFISFLKECQSRDHQTDFHVPLTGCTQKSEKHRIKGKQQEAERCVIRMPQ